MLVSLRLPVSVSTLATIFLTCFLSTELAFCGVERRFEIVGGAGELIGKLGHAGQKFVDALGIVTERLGEFLSILDRVGKRTANVGNEAFEVGESTLSARVKMS